MSNRTTRLYIAPYFDENITVDLAPILAKEQFDVLTAHDAGMLGKSDLEQLQYAVSCERAIVTHDRDDFVELYKDWLEKNRKHFGIIILIRRTTLKDMAQHLLDLLNAETADEMENGLRFV